MAASSSSPASASPLESQVSPVARESSGKATAALVLGIIGVVTSVIPIVGLILGIIATVRGSAVRKACRRRHRDAPWQATAGFVLGIVAILASVAVFAVNIAALS